MNEEGAKHLDDLQSRVSIDENDRADTLFDACEDGNDDGDGVTTRLARPLRQTRRRHLAPFRILRYKL